jgi:prolyl-tRNA synthetase
VVNVLALPVVVGCKTPAERFAGAVSTLTLEGMMRDGKALQMGTSHELGQNFATAFGIEFLDAGGDRQVCWTTSWGVSTRLIGALIMGHGDDRGLIVPPRLAPIQVVVVQVGDEAATVAAAGDLLAGLTRRAVRVHLDGRTDQSFGRRSIDWELKGVPMRLEVGARDLAAGEVTVVRRDRADKERVPLEDVVDHVVRSLEDVGAALMRRAVELRDERIVDVATTADAVDAAGAGWARVPWSVVAGPGERRLADAGVTVRCLQRADGSLPDSADESDLVAYCARAY